MTLPVPSGTDLKNLLSNGWWALRLIWSTNAVMTAGLVMSAVVRALVPAGLAVFARGLINVFVGNPSLALGLDAILPWVLLGFGITILEATAPLAQRFCTQRLHDDMNIRITSDIL